ncbi:MAG: hypothetical protein ABIV51_06160 [Saprospiraceae bacterium]
MTNPFEIRILAAKRLEEAEILLNNGKFEGAFYLAGYSIELTLKAKICEHLDVPNLFASSEQGKPFLANLRKAVKIHNLETLFTFSGLANKLDIKKSGDQDFSKLFGLIVCWNEDARYSTPTDISEISTRKIIEFLKAKNGLLAWITQN